MDIGNEYYTIIGYDEYDRLSSLQSPNANGEIKFYGAEKLLKKDDRIFYFSEFKFNKSEKGRDYTLNKKVFGLKLSRSSNF